MKVKCIKYFDAYGEPAQNHESLSIGKEYEVFGIEIGAYGDRDYHLISSDREPALPHLAYHPAKAFEIIDASVPSNWSVKLTKAGTIGIGPSTWQSPGFLESLYDGDAAAFDLFEQEKDRRFHQTSTTPD